MFRLGLVLASLVAISSAHAGYAECQMPAPYKSVFTYGMSYVRGTGEERGILVRIHSEPPQEFRVKKGAGDWMVLDNEPRGLQISFPKDVACGPFKGLVKSDDIPRAKKMSCNFYCGE